MSKNVSRLIISIGALLIIFIRHIFPQLHIDTIDLILLVILILPWFSDLIKEIEVPGFGKIGFQDVKSAGDKIGLQNTFSNENNFNKSESDLNSDIYLSTDSNILLVILQTQIEKRIRQLAENNKIPTSLSVANLINELVHREILKPSMGTGLIDLINLGYQAARGVKVDPNAALWVKGNSSQIFKSLDDIIKSTR
jgi:hypothetical protein